MTNRKKTFATLAAGVLLAGGAYAGWAFSSPSVEPFAYLRAKPATKPSDLTVRFLGAATLTFDDGQTALMEDGFFSRPGILAVLTRKLAPNEARIDAALRQAQVGRVAAIFVAHSHYDHAFDTGLVAQKTGTVVLGSSSTANIVKGAGLPANRMRLIKDGDTLTYGKFKITVFETPHSPDPSYPGSIDQPLRTPAKSSAFKVGENYSFLFTHGTRRILVVGSGNYVPGKFKGIKADVVFLGIGTFGRQTPQFAANYWHEAVAQTGAKLVVPIHWDNFFRPLDEPLVASPRALDSFDASMKLLLPLARRDGVTLRLPVAFAAIDLDQR